ncbi:MAG TPA: Rrf2 family transcriptional regulator [Lachnospiraceae bacterium]|nr:Rrf2 family transcriptional regulator [Lachnospiraceae bacterium]
MYQKWQETMITNETDYAIRIIRALEDGQVHSVKVVCEEENIPLKFAYKILGKLRDAGIVSNTSGVHGGSRLTGDLRQFTLLDLMGILENRSELRKCLVPGYRCDWKDKKKCSCQVQEGLLKIQKKIDRELSRYSIYDLLHGNPDLKE